jgi:NADH:ubiquinone oxidoreductase subunit E
VTLGHEECLGACAWAPMMRVDDVYHEDLDAESAKRILDALR